MIKCHNVLKSVYTQCCSANVYWNYLLFYHLSIGTTAATSVVTEATVPPQPTCTHGKQFDTCGTACPLTCDNYRRSPFPCPAVCVTGCFCPQGLVQLGDTCVPPSSCPGELLCSHRYVAQFEGVPRDLSYLLYQVSNSLGDNCKVLIPTIITDNTKPLSMYATFAHTCTILWNKSGGWAREYIVLVRRYNFSVEGVWELVVYYTWYPYNVVLFLL